MKNKKPTMVKKLPTIEENKSYESEAAYGNMIRATSFYSTIDLRDEIRSATRSDAAPDNGLKASKAVAIVEKTNDCCITS